MSDPESPVVEPAAVPLSHMDALPPGTRLGEFELQGLLGVGGFGMVYKGYDHSLHRPVAIKEYMPSALVGRAADMQVSARSSADMQPYQTGLQSFIAEARLLARFDHPSLVKVYRFWEANNTAYMVMPLYSGITLKQARSQMSGPPPEAWLRTVLWSVLEALKVLHANHTLHRDVSPDNIFLQDVGPPVLLDLGAARRAIMDSSHKHTAVLKVNYAPIEQYADAKDLREGSWTDMYAVAAVVHGCVCNAAPLPATFRVVRDRMPSFRHVARTVKKHFDTTYGAEFVRAVDHALIIQPEKRTQTVEAFAQDMQLRAPDNLAQFDWRAQLGDSVTLMDTPSSQALLPTAPNEGQDDTTQPGARVADHVATQIQSASTVSRQSRKRRTRARMAKTGRSRWWWLVAVVLLLVSVLAYKVSHRVLKADAPLQSVPANAPAPAQPPRAARPENRSDKTQAAPAAAAQRDGRELCADSNLLTRPMCLQRECQKPEFAKTPLCVETLKRWEEQGDRTRRSLQNAG